AGESNGAGGARSEWRERSEIGAGRFSPGSLCHFEQAGRAHSAADAHRDHNVFHCAPLALDERMPSHPRAAHPVWMADRNRATVDVQPLVRDAQPVAAIYDLARKRFVEFPQPDVVHLEAVTLQQLGHRVYRPDSHLVGSASRRRHPAIDAERVLSALLGLRAFHQHADRGAVGELARVARGDEITRTLYRRQREQPFQSGAGAVAFVALERDLLVGGLAGLLVIEALGNRGADDLVFATSGLLRGEGSLLTLERILVLSFA